MTLKLGSLCTGYGGLDLAVENHFKNKGEEVQTVWFADNDKKCSELMSHHWDVPNLGDVTTIDWNTVPSCNILTAGFPCQPFSIAGKRLGDKDDRAIFEHIAEGISILRPEWVILENVQGILTHSSGGGTSVIGTLTSMGYDARWGVVRASDAGAPHRRARWYCIATNASRERHGSREINIGMEHSLGEVEGEVQQQWSWQEPEHRTEEDYWEYTDAIRRWERVTRPAPAELYDHEGASSLFVEWMMGLPEGWVTGHGFPRSRELKILGNGVVVQAAELALSLLDEWEGEPLKLSA